VITCPKCSKQNQDHYKFCLGCGAELPREATKKSFSAQTPPHGVSAVKPTEQPPPPAPAPVAAPQPAPVAAPAAIATDLPCPQCGHVNGTGNRFCAGCGYNLAAARSVAPAAPSPAPAAPSPTPAAAPMMPVSLVALRADGTEAGRYELPAAEATTVGRDTGSVFAGDSYLSPRHATFTRRGSTLSLKDEGSLNGVYLKLVPDAPWHLEYEDVFRIGQEIIRFEALKHQPQSPDGVERFGSPAKGYIGRLALVIGRDTTGNAFPIPARGVHCGRERGDILFSEDGYVSGLHCRVARSEDNKVYLTDVGSSNGTFVRLRAERELVTGDVLLMGQQLFRVDF
jgi:pSer/pThr/pTyr-binding forkhead associated (FHA) protein